MFSITITFFFPEIRSIFVTKYHHKIFGALLRTIFLFKHFFCVIATIIVYDVASFNELFVFLNIILLNLSALFYARTHDISRQITKRKGPSLLILRQQMFGLFLAHAPCLSK